MAQLDAALATHAPRVVVIGLSLANEGLQRAAWWSVEEVLQRYTKGLRRLARRVERAGATAVIGGVYPHGAYTPLQARVLFAADATLKAWPYKHIDFLSAVSDARGHWRSGLDQNDGHPNDAAHAAQSEFHGAAPPPLNPH